MSCASGTLCIAARFDHVDLEQSCLLQLLFAMSLLSITSAEKQLNKIEAINYSIWLSYSLGEGTGFEERIILSLTELFQLRLRSQKYL